MNYNNLDLSRTQEVWVQITDRVVPNIRPHYYISNWGRVGSMASGTFKIIELIQDSEGYLMVNLHLYPHIREDDGLRRQILKRVNRLVIMSFYPLPENYEDLEVNHINSIRNDNHLWNLEWATSRENVLHAIKYGNRGTLDISGSKNPMAKLTEDDVYEMAELAKTGNYTYSQLGQMFNIATTTVYNILSGRAWSHLKLDISEDDLNIIRAKGNTFRHSELPFTIEEMHKICNFFNTRDINNKNIYPKLMDILKDCFYTLELDKKYDFKTKKRTLTRILDKSRHNTITDNYNYKFIR